jgi:hypothetical protein
LLKKDQGQFFAEIYHLQNCELALGEFYQQLADFFVDQRWFWQDAVSDEVNHARQVGKLISLISSDLSKYEVGRYRLATLQTYLDGLYSHIESVKKKEVTAIEVLKLACDYEKSALESKPFDIVTSSDPAFSRFKLNLLADLEAHSKKIVDYAKQKIDSMSG